MARKEFSRTDMENKKAMFKPEKKYVKGKFQHSNIDINPADKDKKEYMLPWVEYLYSLFLKKKTWMGADYDSISTMRAYMEGDQSVDIYRDFLYGAKKTNATSSFDGDGYDIRDTNSTDSADRIAWVNIDEKPLSIAPKIMTKLLEQAREVYYEMGVNAIDSMSAHTEEMEEARLWFEKENHEYLNGQRALIGIGAKEPDFMPINVNELELYKQSGGFKVPYAVAAEQLIKHTFEISDMDKEVKEKWLKDLASIRYALCREYFDEEDQRIKVKYVDPEFGAIQFSRDFSFKDSEYGMEIEEWPISKVRRKFDLSHDEAASLAYANSNYLGNPGFGNWGTYGFYDLESNSCGFDFYKVKVFRCEWIDIDNEKYYKKQTANGIVFNKPLGNKNPEGLEVFDRPIRYVREATWIAGTQFMADYGKMKFIPRPNAKKPRISYRGVRLGVPALMHQIKPLLNGLTMAWWKTQEAIGIAIANGIAVDVGALKNVSIGKDKSWDVLQIMEYYRQRAVMLHKKSNLMNFGQGGGASPVTPLITNMERNIIAQFDMMDKFMNMIESISGINLVSTGSSPEPRTGKFNMQVALQGTGQIISSVIRATTELQADVGVNVLSRIRGIIKAVPKIRESYSGVIGEAQMKSMLLAEKSNVEYGISIDARDNSSMRAFVEEVLAASMKATPGEGTLLDLPEVILVRDMMDQKQNMRLISLTLGYILRKKGKERELSKMKAIELQGQQLVKVEQEKQKNKQGDQMFELFKMKKQFEYDYKLQNGKTPGELMADAVQATPPQQRVPIEGAPQQAPVQQEQPVMEPQV